MHRETYLELGGLETENFRPEKDMVGGKYHVRIYLANERRTVVSGSYPDLKNANLQAPFKSTSQGAMVMERDIPGRPRDANAPARRTLGICSAPKNQDVPHGCGIHRMRADPISLSPAFNCI